MLLRYHLYTVFLVGFSLPTLQVKLPDALQHIQTNNVEWNISLLQCTSRNIKSNVTIISQMRRTIFQ